jgi:MerR family copper efflux transcriptional regulator
MPRQLLCCWYRTRHFQRDENNYRNYNEKAIERLKVIKKFQIVGCSLAELKDFFQERDTHSLTNLETMSGSA